MYLCFLDQPGEVLLHRNLRARQSVGKSYGFSGKKIGNVHLKWAFFEAAVLFVRNNPEGQKLLARSTATAASGSRGSPQTPSPPSIPNYQTKSVLDLEQDATVAPPKSQ
jgi:hypothetical protein